MRSVIHYLDAFDAGADIALNGLAVGPAKRGDGDGLLGVIDAHGLQRWLIVKSRCHRPDQAFRLGVWFFADIHGGSLRFHRTRKE